MPRTPRKTVSETKGFWDFLEVAFSCVVDDGVFLKAGETGDAIAFLVVRMADSMISAKPRARMTSPMATQGVSVHGHPDAHVGSMEDI